MGAYSPREYLRAHVKQDRIPNGSRKARESKADQQRWPILVIEEDVVLE
jgi:hypothetical protein